MTHTTLNQLNAVLSVLIRLIKKYHHQLGDDIFPSITEPSATSEEIDTPIIQESAGI